MYLFLLVQIFNDLVDYVFIEVIFVAWNDLSLATFIHLRYSCYHFFLISTKSIVNHILKKENYQNDILIIPSKKRLMLLSFLLNSN